MKLIQCIAFHGNATSGVRSTEQIARRVVTRVSIGVELIWRVIACNTLHTLLMQWTMDRFNNLAGQKSQMARIVAHENSRTTMETLYEHITCYTKYFETFH